MRENIFHFTETITNQMCEYHCDRECLHSSRRRKPCIKTECPKVDGSYIYQQPYAAAPELLEACELVCEDCEEKIGGECLADCFVGDAIKKARGEDE